MRIPYFDRKVQTHTPPWWGLAGVGILSLGLLALIWDIELWNIIWYVPAWYGYLLILDAMIFMAQRRSFVSHRKREALAMLFWSVPFWYLFEAYNIVLKNWYYVFGLHTDWIAVLFEIIAFATVLPACLVHAELLKAFGCWADIRWNSLTVSHQLQRSILVLGFICIILPLLMPRTAFWLVWGAALAIPEVINFRCGSASLLRDLEAGKPGRMLRLLAGGALAGIAWEGFNYWARCKWIYTVPGLEDWKIFEMPILGFLGFPVLALNAFAFYSFICHLIRGGKHWEETDMYSGKPVTRFRFWIAVSVACIFSWVVGTAVVDYSLRSRRPLLPELNGMDSSSVDRLVDHGIGSPEILYRTVLNRGIRATAEETEVEIAVLEQAFEHTALAIHKGMGTNKANALIGIGIHKVEDLVDSSARDIYDKLVGQGIEDLREAEVKVWIRATALHRHPHP